MKEWSIKNEYCGFNSWKGLAYIQHYNSIVRDVIPVPIEASIDPTALCQLSCDWCNSFSFLSKKGTLYDCMAMRKFPPGHLLNLVSFLLDWGVKGYCFGGGGEPSLNNEIKEGIKAIINRRRSFSLVTNGIFLSPELLSLLPLARWVGVSVDAAIPSTYKTLKGLDVFPQVINNIKRIIDFREKFYDSKIIKPGNCDISYKFLIVPENQWEIYDACKKAKELGVNEFHARPASIERREVYKNREDTYLDFELRLIKELFEACHQLEDESFKVITSFHKFSKDFRIKNDFSRCWASALQIQCCADGNFYVCQDQRINLKYKLGSHYPDPENILNFWGKEEHIALLKSINPREDCPRCFVAGTKVYTKKGIKNIENIDSEEEVLTQEGRLRQVVQKYKSKFQGELVSIYLWGNNNRIEATPDHKFWGIKVEKCSFQGRNNYCLGEPCSILRQARLLGSVAPGCLNPSQNYKPILIKGGDLSKEYFLLVPKIKDNNSLNLWVEDNPLIKERFLISEISSDMAWLIGIYLAEGRYNIHERNQQINFYLSEQETDLADKISSIIGEHYGIKNQKAYIREGSLTLGFHSQRLVNFLRPFGKGANSKRIPWKYIQSFSREAIIELIRGYFDGDGCYHTSKRGDQSVQATSVSVSLIYDVSFLLSKLGVFSRIRKENKRESQIGGRKIYYRSTPYTIFISPNEASDMIFPGKFQNRINHPRYIYETNLFFGVPIRSKKFIGYKGEMYNLEIEEDHSYTVERVAVENCTYGPYQNQIEQVILEDKMCLNFP
jgi:intein/homing endonuclease